MWNWIKNFRKSEVETQEVDNERLEVGNSDETFITFYLDENDVKIDFNFNLENTDEFLSLFCSVCFGLLADDSYIALKDFLLNESNLDDDKIKYILSTIKNSYNQMIRDALNFTQNNQDSSKPVVNAMDVFKRMPK